MSTRKTQKVPRTGSSLSATRALQSRWFAKEGNFATMLAEDLKIREYLKTKLKSAAVSRILIERPAKNARITIFSARPGIVIGKKGEDIENLKAELTKRLGKPVAVNIEENHRPGIDAQLIAEGITQQLEKRIMFRRVMKRAMNNAMRLGAQGIKIMSSGRLNGIEIARCEWYREGRVPLHTLRADIDYGFSEAKTTYGVIGVKVWVYRGDRLANGEAPPLLKTEVDDDRRQQRGSRPSGDRPDAGRAIAPAKEQRRRGTFGGVQSSNTNASVPSEPITAQTKKKAERQAHPSDPELANSGSTVSSDSQRYKVDGQAAQRSGLVGFRRLYVPSQKARAAMLAVLPGWAQQQQASDVARLKLILGGDTEPDRLMAFVCNEMPAPIRLRSNTADGRFDENKRYAVLGRFASGTVRTVGSVDVDENGAGKFVPFGFWSLLDPNDEGLNPRVTQKIESTIDLLAVESC